MSLGCPTAQASVPPICWKETSGLILEGPECPQGWGPVLPSRLELCHVASQRRGARCYFCCAVSCSEPAGQVTPCPRALLKHVYVQQPARYKDPHLFIVLFEGWPCTFNPSSSGHNTPGFSLLVSSGSSKFALAQGISLGRHGFHSRYVFCTYTYLGNSESLLRGDSPS